MLSEEEEELFSRIVDPMRAEFAPGYPRSRRLLAAAAGLLIAGVAGLLAGVAVNVPLLGVAGFVAMLAGVVLWSRPRGGPRAPKASKAKHAGAFTWAEKRWEERRTRDS